MSADPVVQFREAILAAGLVPPDAIEADGKLRRFPSSSKRGDDAGWYLLHGDGIPSGSFGDWRTGLAQSWRADIGRQLTPAEEAAHRSRVETMRREREAEEARQREEAATKAAAIWKDSEPATDGHRYLARKGIKANGARLHKGSLVIAMQAGDKLHSLQCIGADCKKRFLTGGRVAGCYFIIGEPSGAAALCIAEGFATAASIHEATGYPAALAFNAGNLLAVAQAMRAQFPDLPLIVCADDDFRTEGNPGMTKATEAARAVGGLLAVPDFGEDRPDGATDFNDMAQLCGAEAVAQAVAGLIDSAGMRLTPSGGDATRDDPASPEGMNAASDAPPMTESEVSEVSGVQASNHAVLGDTPAEIGGVSEVSGEAESPIPKPTERPAFRVFDDWLEHGGEKHRPGVWYFDTDKDGNSTQSWICSPLRVVAVTLDGQDNNFGRLLRFRTTAGRWREWAMPMDLLVGDGAILRGELLSMGVEIAPSQKARNLLATFLQDRPPNRRMRCATQVGWCDESFVLTNTVIGPKSSAVIFQSGERGHDEHTRAGTLAGWQEEISARAVGNPLLQLALSASFAGPLLGKCNGESGGIHFVGDSSTGKTTAIEAACATWGGPGYRRSWRATANRMEGAASLFNDCLLALDEISECPPREIGAIVYALGNGRGKQRAKRSGAAREVDRWRCMVLSSGERTIATAMLEGGHRAKAGQSVRLLDLPAARRYGAWDDLHGMSSPAAFSDALKRAAVQHHGCAGRAFLERLTRDGRDFCALLERIKGLAEFSADGGEGQDKRAAGRFALLALAGELATEYGITKWPEGAAIEAASEGFKAWRGLRGRGNDERRQILERVSGFIERHGDGRFSDADATGASQVRDRAGWWRDGADSREYLLTSEAMREAVKGFDFNRALDALQEAGALPAAGADGKRSRAYRIGGRSVRLYPVRADRLVGDHGA